MASARWGRVRIFSISEMDLFTVENINGKQMTLYQIAELINANKKYFRIKLNDKYYKLQWVLEDDVGLIIVGRYKSGTSRKVENKSKEKSSDSFL